MMASGKLHVPKKYTAFVLHADNGKEPGLFRFRKAIPSMKGMKRKEWDEARYDAKLDRIQYFERPVKPPTWDWRGECEKRLHEFFDAGFIFRHYITPAINGIAPEKKPYTPKG
jgi:hypothetical protein